MKYRHKPLLIDAFQWNLGENVCLLHTPAWFHDAISQGEIYGDSGRLRIKTALGLLTANSGDFICRHESGELAAYAPELFRSRYELDNGAE